MIQRVLPLAPVFVATGNPTIMAVSSPRKMKKLWTSGAEIGIASRAVARRGLGDALRVGGVETLRKPHRIRLALRRVYPIAMRILPLPPVPSGVRFSVLG
uniref:Uncharacterized protein n=1 Tax=Candidatus Kentrum sp. TC TaxID=2126339 RepID=A0A450ZLE5_9GAMM|nr:MAG: hypothetical protein BECKTC1821F_GA0114240_100561 [Candidatus Kentron sp. TC]